MTGKDLLEKVSTLFLKVNANDRTAAIYNEIAESLSSFTPIDFFFQLKKNEKGQGLALEIMLFDNNLIHDIVIAQTICEHIIIFTNDVTKFTIETNYGIVTNEKGENTAVDLLHFHISYGSGLSGLVYKTDLKRYTEINRISNNLLKTIKR